MLSQASDRQLWRASCDGDRSAFGEVIGRYQDSVCGVTYALTGNRALSEDLAQDAFLTAWQRLQDVREPERLGAWLCGIARNLGRRARATAKPLPLPADIPASDRLLDDALAEHRREALVWNALAGLPTKYREPLVLYYTVGRSARSVGALLGLTTGAVEQRLSRGRKRLRREVEATVEKTLERARPGPEFRHRVAAVLPFAAGPLAPITGAPRGLTPLLAGIAMQSAKTKTMIAIAVGLVALVAVIWLLPTATPAHDGQPALTSGERKETPERHASRSRSAETTRAAAQLTTPDARDKETDLAQDEPPLQLTRHGSRATVNLDGGPSTMASFATRGAPFTYDTANPEDDDGLHSLMIPPPAPNPASTCAVTGIVTDAQGLALPGALVLAGAGVTSERTPGREAYAVADEGTVADDTGRFSIEVDASTGFNAVALNEDGWSQLASVPAGTDAVHLDLQIAGGARLQGTVRRANTGVAAVISASPTDLDNVDLSTHSGEDGRYELTLPPGTYRVEATINGTLESKAVEQTVTIPADGSATADFDLPVGTLVAVQIELSDDLDVGDVGDVGDGAEGLMVLEWTLLPGQHALAGPQGAVRVRSELDSADYFHSSSFSLDVDELLGQVRQFVDIESGMWTACAELRQMAAKNLTGVGFSCTQFTVKPGQEVAEVVLTLLAL